MKKCYAKNLSVLMAVLIFIASSYGQATFALAADSADIVNNTAEVSSLLGKINDAREGVSKAALTQDSGLDKVAYAYASELINAGPDFRKTTDFKTLPNGDSVYSLAAANGVTGISGFNYSVWLGGYKNLESTNEFSIKAVNGDFTNVGIACCMGSNGYKVAVLMFSNSTASTVTMSEKTSPTASADIVNDTAEVSSLLGKINEAREGVSRAALTQDSGLDKVAYAYASELINAGSDFRRITDFKTLPNGDSVYSLAAANGVTGILSFNYSVWLGGYKNLESTDEFSIKAVNGDFTKVGVACCTGTNGYKVVVLVFSK